MKRPPGREASLQVPPTAPSHAEAWEIVKAIAPCFRHYVDQYNKKKYQPKVYQRLRRDFRQRGGVTRATLRQALLWKYGHLGKPAIPAAHQAVISQLQRGWRAAAAVLPSAPEDAFLALDKQFGGKTRFITIAFLLHLLHPSEVPIIDQHNFRAVNALLAGVRPGWRPRKQPSRYADIMLVAAFMKALRTAWSRRDPAAVPSNRRLDKFLMMYGKSIKGRTLTSRERMHIMHT